MDYNFGKKILIDLPLDKRRRFNVYKTYIRCRRRHIDVL